MTSGQSRVRSTLALGQAQQHVQVPYTSLPEQRIFHHVGQGRRDRQRQFEGRSLGPQPIEELDQRDVRFRHRLEEPPLFQKQVVFRMADVRQMGVQN